MLRVWIIIIIVVIFNTTFIIIVICLTCRALSRHSTETLGSTIRARCTGETIRHTLSHHGVSVSTLGAWIFIGMSSSIGTVIPSGAGECLIWSGVLITVEACRAFCTIPLAGQVVICPWWTAQGEWGALRAVTGHWTGSSYIWFISY